MLSNYEVTTIDKNMKNDVIYALDFDGVICDSAIETGITGWKAASKLWTDMSAALPPPELIDQFRFIRPIIETGYEAILVMRMLYKGENRDAILSGFVNKKQAIINKTGKDIDFLKQLFGKTRDTWIQDALPEWVRMNPLFPGVGEKLQTLGTHSLWYIVTTKQERFVTQILKANQIELPASRIFGLDRKMNKEAILTSLMNNHPDEIIYFVEDRLPTLLNVINNDKLQDIRLFFATWGYNTEQDKLDAEHPSIERVNCEDFLDYP